MSITWTTTSPPTPGRTTTRPGVPLPSFHYNRFGGAIGGPLIPKELLGGKTYFFANYQGFRWPNSQTIEKTVPSAAMRLGLLRRYDWHDYSTSIQTR